MGRKVFHSNSHLQAEADYRREAVARRVPLDMPDNYHFVPKERRLRSVPHTREGLVTRARSALGRLVEVARGLPAEAKRQV